VLPDAGAVMVGAACATRTATENKNTSPTSPIQFFFIASPTRVSRCARAFRPRPETFRPSLSRSLRLHRDRA